MGIPLSPSPVRELLPEELPAYLSNGLVGLRVMHLPLLPGVAIVSGLSQIHPALGIEVMARAPYPLAGDLAINGVWLRAAEGLAQFEEQVHDFGVGELTSRFSYSVQGTSALVEVLAFCSRTDPTLVCQQMTLTVDAPANIAVRVSIDPLALDGETLERNWGDSAGGTEGVDGWLRWRTHGALTELGLAYATTLLGADAERATPKWDEPSFVATEYQFHAEPRRNYVLRQIVSLVPSALHSQPHRQAVRLASRASAEGFEEIRNRNRAAWKDLWRGRIELSGAERRWQELTDAAFYYLNASVHPASPSSTSIFGLAQWTDYHYYYGHVMWDIETFSVPALSVLQPHAAKALLGFRTRSLPAATNTAKMAGRRGAQFPWEAGALHGDEAAPDSGKAAWYEDHVSLDIAWAFAQFAHATGDPHFAADEAWPVVSGVADWITSRCVRTTRGYEIRRVMGIAERDEPSDNESFTAMVANVVLQEAIELGQRLDKAVPPEWSAIRKRLVVPTNAAGDVIISYDGWQPNQKKGATPAPLAGLFPFWYPAPDDVRQATLRRYLDLADQYVGQPMLSSPYGVWACWAGDRELALRLLDEGYAQLHSGRFLQTLEQRPDREPDKPRAGPFFANLGGYLSGLLFGMPGIHVNAGEPSSWPVRQVVLPAGWTSIDVDRIWVRGRPATLQARQGAERAVIDLHDG